MGDLNESERSCVLCFIGRVDAFCKLWGLWILRDASFYDSNLDLVQIRKLSSFLILILYNSVQLFFNEFNQNVFKILNVYRCFFNYFDKNLHLEIDG